MNCKDDQLYTIKRRELFFWKALLIFIKNPHDPNGNVKDLGLKKIFLYYCRYLQILLIYAILIALINAILSQFGVLILKNFLNNAHTLKSKLTGIQYIFLIGLIAPLYEEIIFRNYLKLNKNNIAISLSVCFFIFYGPFIASNNFVSKDLYIRLLYAISAFALVKLVIKHEWIEIIKQKYFKWVFYFSIAIFGYGHIFNFSPLNISIVLLSPILVIPQLFAGLILGYIRLNNGLKWSICLHVFINVGALIFGFFL